LVRQLAEPVVGVVRHIECEVEELRGRSSRSLEQIAHLKMNAVGSECLTAHASYGKALVGSRPGPVLDPAVLLRREIIRRSIRRRCWAAGEVEQVDDDEAFAGYARRHRPERLRRLGMAEELKGLAWADHQVEFASRVERSDVALDGPCAFTLGLWDTPACLVHHLRCDVHERHIP